MKYSALLLSISIFFSCQSHLDSSQFHRQTRPFSNLWAQLDSGDSTHIAFLGGSITHNPGWRDSLMLWFRNQYPQNVFQFTNAGIPSMGSTPGAFRLQRDVLSKGKVDLLLVEAAVNDQTNGRSNKAQIRAMEGIVRQAKRQNPELDILFMYFVDPDKMEEIKQAKVPSVIQNHEMVASHYDIPSINLAREVTMRIDQGEFSWEEDFINLHPSAFGQKIYFQSIKQFLRDNQKLIDTDAKPYVLPPKLDSFCYERAKIVSLNAAQTDPFWEFLPVWTPEDSARTRVGYTGVPMLSSATTGASLQLAFEGTAVGISVAAGPDAGQIWYRIDGGDWYKRDLFSRWSQGLHLPWYYMLADELEQGEHLLQIRIAETRNAKSLGQFCRIKHFFVNGKEI